MIHKSFKTELQPNNKQRTLFAQHAGCARFAYNWALALLKDDYDSGRKEIKPTAITLHQILNIKKRSDYPWMHQCSKWSAQNALRNIETAYNRFFKKVSDFPKFKKRGRRDSFTLDTPVVVYDNKIKLPRIGVIRLKERGYIPVGKPKKATISLRAGRWFVSVQYEVEPKKTETIDGSIGVDLGIKTFATLSDGTIFETNHKLKHKEEQLKRFQRKLARQVKGSKSRNKTKKMVGIVHYHISNSRKDLIHKTTSFLVKTKPENRIVIEDLNVKGMMKNHHLAKSVANIGAYEFRRQLGYKCAWYGKQLVIADRWFPSSKMDHKTGMVNKDLKLSNRIIYHADGSSTDRDLNAAINLSRYTARHAGINADGDEKSISLSQDSERCSSLKSEGNSESAFVDFCKFPVSECRNQS